MRPIEARNKYIIAKARMLSRILNLSPPVNVNKLLQFRQVRLEFILDLCEPTVVKYGDDHIILIPPYEKDEEIRWVATKKFAHVYLGHFKIYPVQRIIFGSVIETLSDAELEILDQEVRIFASELLMPGDFVKNFINYPVSNDQIPMLEQYFGLAAEIVLDRLAEFCKASPA